MIVVDCAIVGIGTEFEGENAVGCGSIRVMLG